MEGSYCYSGVGTEIVIPLVSAHISDTSERVAHRRSHDGVFDLLVAIVDLFDAVGHSYILKNGLVGL